MVSADDFGKVKLFSWPCAGSTTRYRGYVGHSSHVANVRFTHADRWVVSAGGADMSLFQWRVIAPEAPEIEESEVDSDMESDDESVVLETAEPTPAPTAEPER